MTKKITIAAVQYKTDMSIEKNFNKIKSYVEEAVEKNVRLILFPECALCGYPPIEIPSLYEIDFVEQNKYLNKVDELSKKHGIYIALGYIHRKDEQFFDSVKIFSPHQEELPIYHKRALWGYDQTNFIPGNHQGIYEIDHIKIGLRICFEIRFPEYFRELFQEEVDVCLLSLCDVGSIENNERRDIIRAHMISRAVENVFYLVSSNSMSSYPTAPTCFISPSGQILGDASDLEEELLVRTLEIEEPTFGQKGIMHYSKKISNHK